MQMVGQDNEGINLKGSLRLGHGNGLSQAGDVIHQQPRPPFLQHHREEHRGSGYVGAKVIGHFDI